MAFLEEPAGFFYEGERPLKAAEITDRYRRGAVLSARALNHTERAWIRDLLDDATGGPNAEGDKR